MNKKNIFIINPMAGKVNMVSAVTDTVSRLAVKYGLDYKIYVTEYKGHATRIVESEAKQNHPRICRFYACGGDGTLNEVVSGAAEHKNAQVACYPCGTGNDYIKIFDNTQNFLDIEKLIKADILPVDIIKVKNHYAINLCSAGIDARIADWVGRNKEKVPFTGKLVYDLSLIINFFSRIYRYYEVEIDDKKLDGNYSIIVAGSGRYYGGGYYAIPEAEPNDGLLDFVLIKKVNHIKLLQLIGKYSKGLHNALGDVQHYLRGKKMVLRSAGNEPFNYDGEILNTREITIELCTGMMDFAVPEGSCLIRSKTEIPSYSM